MSDAITTEEKYRAALMIAEEIKDLLTRVEQLKGTIANLVDEETAKFIGINFAKNGINATPVEIIEDDMKDRGYSTERLY